MKKLNLEDLKSRGENISDKEMLDSIGGGTENSCHIVVSDDGNVITIYGPNSGTIIIKN